MFYGNAFEKLAKTIILKSTDLTLYLSKDMIPKNTLNSVKDNKISS